MQKELEIINQFINPNLYIKRVDLVHDYVSGNKFYKLKYNLLQSKRQSIDTVLTFGGAFSNHIAATAYAAKKQGLKSIGVIRGEELNDTIQLNPTLQFAKQNGMRLHFVSRLEYKTKNTIEFQNGLREKFGNFYLIPEGGTNTLAVKGCEDILIKEDDEFDYISCSVGTGGTISGIINASNPNQKIIGFSALKGEFLNSEISKFTSRKNWELNTDYHFGGYAKINSDLVAFINKFKSEYNIPLDPIYTGKMMYGIFDLINKGYFESDSKILVIHTGGLQGIDGMNIKLKQKKLPQLIK